MSDADGIHLLNANEPAIAGTIRGFCWIKTFDRCAVPERSRRQADHRIVSARYIFLKSLVPQITKSSDSHFLSSLKITTFVPPYKNNEL